MKIVSFFAGAGGLDLGFENAGFDVVWANEYDKEIWETFEKNHTNKEALSNIKQMFTDIGYDLSFELLNVSDYGVPQDRKRVFFIGFNKDL